MQDLSKLLEKLLVLEKGDGDLAWLVRCVLSGFKATLQEAKKKYTNDDPEITNYCEELLETLNRLLELEPGQDRQFPDTVLSPVEEDNYPFEAVPLPDTSAVPSPQSELELISLGDTFRSNTQLQKYLGDDLQLQSKTDSELWKEMQCLLLRVPTNVAESERQKLLERAKEFGTINEDQRSFLSFPFSRDEPLYPSLIITKDIKARGLKLSKKLLDKQRPEISQNEDLFFLAGVVFTYLKFIEFDSSLHHALKSVYRFGVTSLNSPQEKSQYIRTLQDRFQRAVAAENHYDPTVTLRARLDLDEAIHSLVYLPPADRYSWWGRLQQESRRTVERVVQKVRNQGHKVQFRTLWGPYADVCALSKDDLELDQGGTPGEVLACLRVYAQINEEVYPGRVLFRSLR